MHTKAESTLRQSEYMHWAKMHSRAKFNLATSGLANLTMSDLRVDLNTLEEITGGGYGYEPLVNAIASRYQVNPDSIVTAAGTSFANHLAVAALIEPGDEVLVESPAYEPLLATIEYLGAEVKRFARRFEDEFQISPEEIGRHASTRTRLIVLTNFHNPSGVISEPEILKEVGRIARQVGARVLVDEVYLEMLFEDPPQTAFHLGHEFVVTSSLTKAYGLSGLRCGWILAEPKLAERMWRLNDVFAATPVHLGERLSVIAFQQLRELAERSQRRLDHNRKLLNGFLDQRDDLQVVRPRAGSIMFPRLIKGNPERFLELLREKYETSVVPGSFFEMPDHFRIGLGGDPEIFAEGLSRLGKALDEFA